MTPRTPDADVVVVGHGPVGAALALRLRQLGRAVVVVDRAAAIHPLPRAVAADAEVHGLVRRLDPSLTEGWVTRRPVRFVSGDRLLGEVRFPDVDGSPGLSFLSQPVLESRLRALGREAGVEARTGDVVGLRGASVELADGSWLTGRWLVGADGARSTVRRLAGIELRGRDLPGEWLVADVAWSGRDRFTYTCDPRLPQVDMPTPEGHRWEWLGADVRDLDRLLTRDGAGGAEVIRAVPYRFAARRASAWQAGPVLLAGDAAHTMPPFAGQGLGAGLRDAWLLAALLTDGDPSGYQRRREPHVRRMTQLSLLLGGLLQSGRAPAVRDALLAAAFRAPVLGGWLGRGGPAQLPM